MHFRSSIRVAGAALLLAGLPAGAQEVADGAYGAFADIAVRDIVGLTVVTGTGENIGEVEQVLKAGADMQAVLGIGGFLGFGEHDVAVPLTALAPADGVVLLQEMDLETLEAMPAFEATPEVEALPLDVTVAGAPAPRPGAVELETTAPEN
ncbi:PRC-barrel domain-containing protein [uncultured Jannaschia sp.]|uniref:PRC-barrel domain-containing protein n=1 Tax=uncultured Jannaschia sp. TaxID=293347 RepID=UPI00260164F8|nr:PRC-barrel domain-containing protein [uncultured Jannaschia sp.]